MKLWLASRHTVWRSWARPLAFDGGQPNAQWIHMTLSLVCFGVIRQDWCSHRFCCPLTILSIFILKCSLAENNVSGQSKISSLSTVHSLWILFLKSAFVTSHIVKFIEIASPRSMICVSPRAISVQVHWSHRDGCTQYKSCTIMTRQTQHSKYLFSTLAYYYACRILSGCIFLSYLPSCSVYLCSFTPFF